MHESLELPWSKTAITEGVRIFDSSVVQFFSESCQYGILRTEEPIPTSGENLSFEITIISPREGPCDIAIGLTAKESFDSQKGIQYLPESQFTGLQKFQDAFGYSSDGKVYGTNTMSKHSEKLAFSGGDTIGCYVDNINAICSFSKNGVMVNKIFYMTNMEKSLFPTIVFGSNEIMININCCEKNSEKFELDLQGN